MAKGKGIPVSDYVEKFTPRKHALIMQHMVLLNMANYRNKLKTEWGSTTHLLKPKEYRDNWEHILDIWGNKTIEVTFPKITDERKLYRVKISKY